MRFLFTVALCVGLVSMAYAQNWPSFRGQNSAGIGDGNAPPTTWDAEKSINVLWKTPIPGLGHSSPIVWGERIFVTTAVSSAAKSQFVHGPTQTPASADDNSKHSFRVYCLNKNTGRIIWEKTIYDGALSWIRDCSIPNSGPPFTGRSDGVWLGGYPIKDSK